MRNAAVLLASWLAAACALGPLPPEAERVFHDELFAASSQRIRAADVFSVSPAMQRYLRTDIARSSGLKGPRKALVDALYASGELKLEYDSAATRNAAQAFEARAGNCLSLVIMTAAFAKEMGLPVRYQNVLSEATWGRSGDTYLSIGHVNLSLGTARIDREMDVMTIDFLPPGDAHRLHKHVISEQTVVAMYLNNRAVETFTRGEIDDAYWWAREAARQDPRFLSAYNTLGVIYRLHGNAREAEQVLRYVLDREPGNANAMANLITVLNDLGRAVEARELGARLAAVEPYPPFYFYNRGLAAMRVGDYAAAKELFAKEVDRAAYYHEFHFWLGMAAYGLGEREQARREIALAMEASTSRSDRDLYAAKLDRLMATRFH